MCCIFACCGWLVDFIQRILTFCLTCCICCAIVLALAVAIIVGVAYGYNYSLAEYIQLARPDVTVYVRRGQFLDDDLDVRKQNSRRSGGGEEALEKSTKATMLRVGADGIKSDYQDPGNLQSYPLSDAWRQAQESKKYAEQLSKYSASLPELPGVEARVEMVSSTSSKSTELTKTTTQTMHFIKLTPIRKFSKIPFKSITTDILQSGDSEIVMRRFQQVPTRTTMLVQGKTYKIDDNFYAQEDDASLKKNVIMSTLNKFKDLNIMPRFRAKAEDSTMREVTTEQRRRPTRTRWDNIEKEENADYLFERKASDGRDHEHKKVLENEDIDYEEWTNRQRRSGHRDKKVAERKLEEKLATSLG